MVRRQRTRWAYCTKVATDIRDTYLQVQRTHIVPRTGGGLKTLPKRKDDDMVADVLEVDVATEAALDAAASRVWLDNAAPGIFNEGSVESGGVGVMYGIGGDTGELPPLPPPSTPDAPPAPAAIGSATGSGEGLSGGDPSSSGDGDGVNGGDGAGVGEVDGGDGDSGAGTNGGEPPLLPLPRSPPPVLPPALPPALPLASSTPTAPVPDGLEVPAAFATMTSEASLPNRV